MTPTARQPLEALPDLAAKAAVLDAPGKRIAGAVRGIGPGTLKDLLSGTWMGHALHPLLTDVVIGSWTSATLLDVLGGRRSEKAAERLIVVGIVAYPPTALTGLVDWADGEPVGDDVRRIGLVHAALNSVGLALYVASLRSRRRGRHGRGVLLALAGSAWMGAAGHLGGHLAYRLGVGVDQTVFDAGPSDWTDALAAEDLRDAQPMAVDVGDTPVLLVRAGDDVLAVHDRCSHRGCSLASGDIEGATVTCACHGSRFDLRSGEILRGPATAPQPAFDARTHDGRIEVRLRQRS
ncbi:MAG: Rieske 2Fe-2S domain-containing protein [Solirubrobacteraceae bacterium]